MRFWCFSDIHADISDWVPPRRKKAAAAKGGRPQHDAVIVAGDICEGFENGIGWIVKHGLNDRPVIVVRGNHEGYRHDYRATMEAAREEATKHPNIHILQNEELVLRDEEGNQVRVLGATLWTDYLLRDYRLGNHGMSDAGAIDLAMERARDRLNDHWLIELDGGRWRPADALLEHQGTTTWLRRKLAEPFLGRTVVVTHHAPLGHSVDWGYCRDAAACYASDLDDLVGRSPATDGGWAGADIWVHGHIHQARSYVHNGCRVISNPRGYPRQSTNWSPRFTFDVDSEGVRVSRRNGVTDRSLSISRNPRIHGTDTADGHRHAGRQG